jgi:hypothetical protein
LLVIDVRPADRRFVIIVAVPRDKLELFAQLAVDAKRVIACRVSVA